MVIMVKPLSLNVSCSSAEPPAVLFHGTSSKLMKQIKNEGLKPMRRQYVHLSVDEQTALQVAKRKEATSVIVTISATKAYLDVANRRRNQLR